MNACSQCGAPLEPSSDPRANVVCKFCHTTQTPASDLRAAELVARGIRDEIRQASDRNQRMVRLLAFVAAGGLLVGVAGFLLRSGPPLPSVGTTPIAPTSATPVLSGTSDSSPSSTSAGHVPSPAVPGQNGEWNMLKATVTLELAKQGGDAGAFEEARRVAVDDNGFAYVADKTGRVQRFDDKGTLLSTLRAETPNMPEGPLSTDIPFIQGLAVDHKGRLFVSIGYDLVMYDAVTLKETGRIRHTPKSTCFRDLVVDQTGILFVRSACSDSDQYSILKMDRNGQVLSTIRESPAWEQNSSAKLALDGAGTLYAPHNSERQIVVLDSQGKPTSRFGGRGDGPGFFRNVGALAVGGKGRLYAIDFTNIAVYDLAGHPLGRLPQSWKGVPQDIAVGPDASLWVVSRESGALRLHVDE